MELVRAAVQCQCQLLALSQRCVYFRQETKQDGGAKGGAGWRVRQAVTSLKGKQQAVRTLHLTPYIHLTLTSHLPDTHLTFT